MQQKFLSQIAECFYRNEKERISNYAFVFPNKRAGIFFKKYLAEIIEQPLFTPRIVAINDFFLQYTPLKVETRIPLLFRLYNVFRENLSKEVDSFELFMPFGETLLSDFEDIAKYNVDARQLFSNIHDLKEIDENFGGLTQEQIAIIRRFWEKLLPETNAKSFNKQFLEMWKSLYQIYTDFNDSLRAEQVGYEGLVFADAMQRLQKSDAVEYEKVVFIGFNALNEQERLLFDFFRQKGIADFYWDTDSPFFNGMTNADAFIKQNAQKYRSHYALQPKEQDKEIEVIAISSGIGQTKKVHDILDGLAEKDENTAVVLPDERLLVPMLCSMPESVTKLNVTMGYPLSLSMVHALAHSLFEMQLSARTHKNGGFAFHYKHVLAVLNNYMILSYTENAAERVKQINAERYFWLEDKSFESDELLKLIFTRYEGNDLLQYLIEVVKKIYTGQKENQEVEKEMLSSYIMMLMQLHDNVAKSGLMLGSEAIASLVDRAAGFSQVPFVGEPLEGVQLMGFLETRTLDFDNVIITSMNDGVCPKKNNSSSIIPYNLRKAFGLPTFEQHDAIAAYHFYRLLTGARRVFLLYDDRVEGTKNGEVSRYVYQLKYLYQNQFSLKEHTQAFDVNFIKSENNTIEIRKDDRIMQKMNGFLEGGKRSLSPSALNEYIQCPLKFYLKKIAEIEEPDEITETIEANVFGSIFHATMELLYKEYKGKDVDANTIERLNASIDNALKIAFSTEYLKITDEKKYESPKGRNILVAHVIKKYVENMLAYDKKQTPFRIVDVERKTDCYFPFADGTKKAHLYGIVDRIHRKGDVFYVADYKTGSDDVAFTDIEQLFSKDEKKHPKAVFQTLMYAMMLKYSDQQTWGARTLQPLIFRTKKMSGSEVVTHIHKKDDAATPVTYNSLADDYENAFAKLLEELFDKDIPFKQCNTTEACQYCTFKTFCDR